MKAVEAASVCDLRLATAVTGRGKIDCCRYENNAVNLNVAGLGTVRDRDALQDNCVVFWSRLFKDDILLGILEIYEHRLKLSVRVWSLNNLFSFVSQEFLWLFHLMKFPAAIYQYSKSKTFFPDT